MTDRELLELAAKAAGIKISRFGESEDYYSPFRGYVAFVETPWTEDDPYDLPRGYEWNPLDDDGDALVLAVDLKLDIALHDVGDVSQSGAFLLRGKVEAYEVHNGDPYAATRRAIVRAAAEIGRAM